MTCVVGVVDDKGGIHFGCDSLGTDGHSGTIISDPKIFQNGEFLIGYAGSYRLGQLLQYSFINPERKEKQTSKQFLCTDFIDSVRLTFELGHFYKESRDEESAGFDGEFIVGYRGEIFLIQGDFSVLHATEDFTSAGAGAETSNAVLYATRNLELKPLDRLHLALDTASHHINAVKPPFHFLSLPDTPDKTKKAKAQKFNKPPKF